MSCKVAYIRGRRQACAPRGGCFRSTRARALAPEVDGSPDAAFWSEFCRSLRRRGLAGVRLVIFDARRPEGRDPPELHRRVVATMPRPLRPQEPAATRPQRPRRHGVAAAFRMMSMHTDAQTVTTAWDDTARLLTNGHPTPLPLRDLNGETEPRARDSNPVSRHHKRAMRTSTRRSFGCCLRTYPFGWKRMIGFVRSGSERLARWPDGWMGNR